MTRNETVEKLVARFGVDGALRALAGYVEERAEQLSANADTSAHDQIARQLREVAKKASYLLMK